MKKILIVEDEPQQVTAYQRKFGTIFSLLIAQNGSDGLDLARKEFPDLIILDVVLPGEYNGFEILDELKKDNKTCLIPVMIVSNLDRDQKQLALNKGAVDFIVKTDISLDGLLTLVKKYLGMINI